MFRLSWFIELGIEHSVSLCCLEEVMDLINAIRADITDEVDCKVHSFCLTKGEVMLGFGNANLLWILYIYTFDVILKWLNQKGSVLTCVCVCVCVTRLLHQRFRDSPELQHRNLVNCYYYHLNTAAAIIYRNQSACWKIYPIICIHLVLVK